MSLSPATHITNQLAHDICVRDAAAATIDGSIASLGKSYVISLQAITCQGGATLAREQVQAADKHYSLSYLGLARGLALAGDAANARKAFQEFFALWKDADQDLRILTEDRRDYAALR